MLQVWNPENSAEEVLVMVCRTGLNTAMGSTIRELLVPAKVTKRDPVVMVCGQHFCRQHVGLLACILMTHSLIKSSGSLIHPVAHKKCIVHISVHPLVYSTHALCIHPFAHAGPQP